MKFCKCTKQNVFTGVLLLLLLLTLGVIFGHSLDGPAESSEKSQAVLENVVKPVLGPVVGEENITEYFVRKLGHFVEFFALGTECFLLLWVRRKFSLHWVLHSLCFGLFVGATDETIQRFTQRGSSLSDVWLDFAGFAVASGLVLLVYGVKKVKFYKNVH